MSGSVPLTGVYRPGGGTRRESTPARKGLMFTAHSQASSPADARRLAAAYLDAHCPGADAEAVQIVVSELVTNAVRHTPDGTWSLVLRLEEGQLILEITDDSPELPTPRPNPPLDGRGGLGLGLVEKLSDHTAVAPTGRGKTITAWWKLPTGHHAERPASER